MTSSLHTFFLLLILIISEPAYAQVLKDRDYWINRYLSVNYPLKHINVTSPYGNRSDPFSHKPAVHHGLDLQASYEEVYAMFDGNVLSVGKDSRSGLYITLEHGNYIISYCHLSEISVVEGQDILAGDVVGVSGNSGRSTGPHLHITVKCNKEYVNPYTLILYIRDVKEESYSALGAGAKSLPAPEDFLTFYAPAAMEQQRKYGIPASVTLSQMAYESGWGQSQLAKNGNNYFGIKATREWIKSGYPYSLHDDDRKGEAFCNYASAEQSIEHHSRLLMSDRYRQCRQYSQTDYHNWLVSIKKAGYATSGNYVKTCEKIIKHHRLYLYDRLAMS